jgi:hypothetical protein
MNYTYYSVFYYYAASSGHESGEINTTNFYNITGNGYYTPVLRYDVFVFSGVCYNKEK